MQEPHDWYHETQCFKYFTIIAAKILWIRKLFYRFTADVPVRRQSRRFRGLLADTLAHSVQNQSANKILAFTAHDIQIILHIYPEIYNVICIQ